MKLIVNADDLGLSRGVNYGILDAYETGIVSSASLMVNMPASDHAINLFKNKEIGLGVHLNVTLGKSLGTCPLLTDQEGFFHRNQVLSEKTIEAIIEEFDLQIQKALANNLKITHVDSHHHIHLQSEAIWIKTWALAQKYGLKIRCDRAYAYMTEDLLKGVQTTQAFSQDFYDQRVHFNHLLFILESHLSKASLELMVHPGFLCGGLIERDSYQEMRVVEHSILTSKAIQGYLQEKNIELIHYGQL